MSKGYRNRRKFKIEAAKAVDTRLLEYLLKALRF